MTPTLYRLDAHGEATSAHHFCSIACRGLSAITHHQQERISLVDEPIADITPGEVCDQCGTPLDALGRARQLIQEAEHVIGGPDHEVDHRQWARAARQFLTDTAHG